MGVRLQAVPEGEAVVAVARAEAEPDDDGEEDVDAAVSDVESSLDGAADIVVDGDVDTVDAIDDGTDE